MKRAHVRSLRLTALLAAVPLGLAVPALAVSAGASTPSAASAVEPSSAPSTAPSDGAGDGTDTSGDVTDGNGDLCDPGFVPGAPTTAPTDPAASGEPSDAASDDASQEPSTASSGDSSDDSGDTSCEDSRANLVGAQVSAAHARVHAGARSHLTVNVATARGTTLSAGTAVLFERTKRIASAPVTAGRATFAARRLTRGTHRLHVALVSSTGSLVRERVTLTITVV